jgi:hypothetical protein
MKWVSKTEASISYHISSNAIPGDTAMAMIKFIQPNHPVFRLRMDASYWDPRFIPIDEMLKVLPDIRRVGDFLPEGCITTSYKGAPKYQPEGIPLLTATNIQTTGIDWETGIRRIDPDSSANPVCSRLKDQDLLFVRSGAGCIGECAVVQLDRRQVNIRNDLFILRPIELEPLIFCTILKSNIIQLQVKRFFSGDGHISLSQDEVKLIQFPLPSKQTQEEIKAKMICSSNDHLEAMKIKSRLQVDDLVES